MKLMSEGTKSWLFGCHSVIHSLLVIRAWKILYKRWPAPWQIVCILIHDIGYWGKDYLTEKSNAGHAELGGKIAGWLFGAEAEKFVLGHSHSSAKKYNLPLSKLEAPDDYSWIIAPLWRLETNTWVEPQLHAKEWQDAVKKNWELHGMHGRHASFEITKKMMLLKEK